MIKKVINVYKRIVQILTHQQKLLFWVVLLGAIISAMFETMGVSIIVPLVNAFMTPEKMFDYEILKPFIRVFNIDENNEMITFVLGSVILLYIIKNIYSVLFSYVKAKYSSKIQRELSVYMMTSYMNRGYTYFLDKNTNQILQGANGDVQGVFNIIDSFVYSITKLLIIMMIGVFMIISDWMIASSLIIAAFICLIIIMICFKKPMKQIGRRLRDYTIEANQVLLQAVQGIKEVLVMRKQKDFVEQYKDNMYKRQKEDIKRQLCNDMPNSIVEMFCVTAIMVVLGLRIMSSSNPTEFIALLASFAVGAFRIMPAIGYISSSFNNIIASLPSLNSVYENMIEARKYNDNFNDVYIEDNVLYKDHIFSDKISINNVTFSYKDELGNVLDKLNLEIKINQSVGLVGESGAGKSTLADILLGILPANEGEICLDEINIREIPKLWSRLIGFVPQTIFLCDSSIAENVAFGERKENIDLDKVKKSLAMANIMTFVETLPDGVWTKVGDRGVRLSGGQRQRIGIARALYRNPQILILDEATSALDNETESSVMDAIENLQGNITMIIIAHRLTTIRKCDHIYEIVNGGAIERTYEELNV